MAVLLYQIGIFIIVQISSFFGKKSRNTSIVLISIFTLLQIYTSGLMIIQFATIIISYWFSTTYISTEKKESEIYLEDEIVETEKSVKIFTENEKKQIFNAKYKNFNVSEIYNEIVENFTKKKYFTSKNLIDIFNMRQINNDCIVDNEIIFDVYIKILLINNIPDQDEITKIELSDFLCNYIYKSNHYTELEKGLEIMFNEEELASDDQFTFGDLKWTEFKILVKNFNLFFESQFIPEEEILTTEEKLQSRNLSKEIYKDLKISELKNYLN